MGHRVQAGTMKLSPQIAFVKRICLFKSSWIWGRGGWGGGWAGGGWVGWGEGVNTVKAGGSHAIIMFAWSHVSRHCRLKVQRSEIAIKKERKRQKSEKSPEKSPSLKKASQIADHSNTRIPSTF